jgi:hypothetical protein
MLAHMRLKFRTESLEQHETLASLPKALRAAISQHLFLPTVQQVYLFQGTSYNFLCQLVSVESSLCDENMLVLRSAVIDGDRGLRFRIVFKFMELREDITE